MNREYLTRTIDHLQNEKAVHDSKFASRPEHANCLERFDTAITKLKDELSKLSESG